MNEFNLRKKFKNTNGITLIALVVTIIILLILAGVSIAMLTGNNGVLTQGKRAKEEQVHSAVGEGIILLYNEYVTEKNIKSSEISFKTKIASTEIIKIAENEGTTENLATFKKYIKNKNIINESGIINVEKLLGQKQSLGNGESKDTGDVYVFEEKNEVYSITYYNKKKEELLIKQFKKGSLEEETWDATDPSLFEISDDGTIYIKNRSQYYMGQKQWNEENLVIPKEINGKKVTKIGDEFSENMGELIKSIKIPDGVTSIEYKAFYGCTGLTSIIIPDSVTSIGYYAFYGCTGLTSIKVASGNTKYDSRNNCNAIIETSSNKLLLGCNNTVIPDTVTSIESQAFSGCTGLTSIIIPDGVTSIGDYAFSGCTGLTSIKVASENTKYDSRNNCNAIIETSSNKLLLGCNNTVIPDTVTSIGDYAFENCTGLTSIIIPDSVTSIEYKAFYGCTGLTSIIIPDGVTSIGNYAFYGCTGLTSITIPDGVTSIGYGAFSNCTGLTTVNYTGTESKWEQISIKSDNECLNNATKVYEYTP